jgi:chemotaxis protein MotA
VTRRLDYTTVAGLAVAAAGILTGVMLEQGQAQDLVQTTAALIVFGGTAGAVLFSTPRANLVSALRRSRTVLYEETRDHRALIERIVGFAAQARRRGIVSIEDEAVQVEIPFLRKALLLVVDGVDTWEVRRQLEVEIRVLTDRAEADARVFEAAAGYAPTVGILGAVLGHIQVMKRLESVGDVGRGIAVAFVATVYGVGAANLLLLPVAAKIRARAAREAETRELIMEGAVVIAEGVHPSLVRSRLENYLDPAEDAVRAERAPAQAAAAGSRA